jgi:hypothetical protein
LAAHLPNLFVSFENNNPDRDSFYAAVAIIAAVHQAEQHRSNPIKPKTLNEQGGLFALLNNGLPSVVKTI